MSRAVEQKLRHVSFPIVQNKHLPIKQKFDEHFDVFVC